VEALEVEQAQEEQESSGRLPHNWTTYYTIRPLFRSSWPGEEEGLDFRPLFTAASFNNIGNIYDLDYILR